MEATTPPAKGKKPRSPGYPAITLEQAIERARTLYSNVRQNTALVEGVLQHWGYKPKSGAGLVAVASLKKFGLIEDEGNGEQRRARLTPLALDILLDEREGSPERQAAIQRAALAPGIHRELHERYAELPPSDADPLFYLVRERGFTESAARDLMAEYRSTLAFAGLTGDADTVSRQELDRQLPDEEESDMSAAATELPEAQRSARRSSHGGEARGQQRSVQLPVPGTSWVTVQGDFPLTEEAWSSMMGLLNAMKPGLVALEDPRPDQD
jgi:hypothetical protein